MLSFIKIIEKCYVWAQFWQGQCPGDERGRGLIVTKVTQLSSPVSACPFQGQRDTILYLISSHADWDSQSGEFKIFFDKNLSSQWTIFIQMYIVPDLIFLFLILFDAILILKCIGQLGGLVMVMAGLLCELELRLIPRSEQHNV